MSIPGRAILGHGPGLVYLQYMVEFRLDAKMRSHVTLGVWTSATTLVLEYQNSLGA
jgi:hypothetical protein